VYSISVVSIPLSQCKRVSSLYYLNPLSNKETLNKDLLYILVISHLFSEYPVIQNIKMHTEAISPFMCL
jgi:hypothetical protein